MQRMIYRVRTLPICIFVFGLQQQQQQQQQDYKQQQQQMQQQQVNEIYTDEKDDFL